MKNPTLTLDVPSNHIIVNVSQDNVHSPNLSGRVFLRGLSDSYDGSCQISVFLVDSSQPQKSTRTRNCLVQKVRMLISQFEEDQTWRDFESAERLAEVSIAPTPPDTFHGRKSADCDFDLSIPCHLPPTIKSSSFNSTYALVASCTFQDGTFIWDSKALRISHGTTQSPIYRSSSFFRYPESSPLTVKVSFEKAKLGSRISIPAILRLNGSNMPSKRAEETKWAFPEQIRWEVEEKLYMVSHSPGAISTEQLCEGKCRPKLRCLPEDSRRAMEMGIEASNIEVPFTITLPKETELPVNSAFSVPSKYIAQNTTPASPRNSSLRDLPQAPVTISREFRLKICLCMQSFTFDKTRGALVEMRPWRVACTISCPLVLGGSTNPTTLRQSDTAPPVYETALESPPLYEST